MDNTKMKEILKAMQGITYLDWGKLQHAINSRFDADVSAAANRVQLADADQIIENYNRMY